MCPHILPPYPALRHWPASTNNDATRILLGLALRPSIGIFGRWPRAQCDTPFHLFFSTLIPLNFSPQRIATKSNLILQIPSPSPAAAAGLPQPDKKGPPVHPFIVPIASFSLLSAFLSYNTAGAGSLSLIYSACTGLVGVWGLWAVSGSLETLTSTVRNPDLRRLERSYLQARRWFLEKLEPTSTRVLSYSATNLLRQNRKSDGNESSRGKGKLVNTPDLRDDSLLYVPCTV